MEKDDEIKGQGNSYDFGARIYDSRLGKFLSTDRLTKQFPHYSPYLFAGNTPIQALDKNGDKLFIVSKNPEFIQKAFDDLQKLTNDKLILLKTGEVVTDKVYTNRLFINSLFKSPFLKEIYNLELERIGSPDLTEKFEVGTRLVNEAINNKYSTYVHSSLKDGNGNEAKARSIWDAHIATPTFGSGKGSDVDIYLDFSKIYEKEINSRMVNEDGSTGRGGARFMNVGHELGHALSAMNGKYNTDKQYDVIDPDKNVNDNILTKEEYRNRIEIDIPIGKEHRGKIRATPKPPK